MKVFKFPKGIMSRYVVMRSGLGNRYDRYSARKVRGILYRIDNHGIAHH
jgi:hypothetical protein